MCILVVMTLVHTVRPKLRPFLYSLLILLTLFYFLSLCLGSVDFFHALLSKAGVSMGCRALSVFLMKMGCSGGLALAIAVILKAIFTAEAEMMMAPSGSHSGAASSIGNVPQDDVWRSLEQPASEGTHSPPLSSRASTPSSSFFRGLSDAAPAPELGEEVQQVSPTHSISPADLRNELSPSAPTRSQDNQAPLVVEQARASPAPQEVPLRDFQHETIKNRLATLTPHREVNDDQVDAIICLKEAIIDRMAQLDPHPFWAEQKDYLVAHGILNKDVEYTMGTLEKNLAKLSQNSFFFFQLRKTRERFA